jgi:hypothetical protein
MLILLVASVFVPVDVPFSIESVAKALPVRQWILLKNPDGSMSSALHNHLTGAMTKGEAFEFDRGDVVDVKFGSSALKTGDPLVTISSNRLGEQLVLLRNELAVEQSNLDVVATGEKQELIRQLKQEIALAKEDFKLRQKTLNRAKQTYAEGLIALQELELAENAYNESEAQIKVAEEALRVAETGQKVEARSFVASRIASLKRQIEFLENKANKYIVTAPFDGLVRFEQTIDGDRLLLEDTTESVLFIPIRLKDVKFIQPGQDISLAWVDQSTIFQSKVLEVGSRVELIGRDQVVTVKALTKEKNLPAGMPIRCRINCGKVRVAEFLKRSIQW